MPTPDTQPGTRTRAGPAQPLTTLLTFPSGMPVALFAALTDLIGAALGDADVVLRAPTGARENSTVVVRDLPPPEITRRLRAATGHLDGAPCPELANTQPQDTGDPVLALGGAIEFAADGGVDFKLGFDDATDEQGMAMLGAMASAMAGQLAAHPEAVNYLEWSWFDPQTQQTFRLIGVRPGQPTPHELRVAAERECDRLRQLLIDNGFDPGAPAAFDQQV